MTSLKSLEQPVEQWGIVLLHLAKKKLDFAEQRDWQNEIKDRSTENMPTMEEFLKFSTDGCNTLRVLNQAKTKPAAEENTEKKRSEKRVFLNTTTSDCKFCKGSHSIYKCEELQKLSPADRKKQVMAKRLCVNCLGSGHFAKDCKSTSCKSCAMRHNTLLHKNIESQSKENNETETKQVVSHCSEDSTSSSRSSAETGNDESSSVTRSWIANEFDDGKFCGKTEIKYESRKKPISGINQAKISVKKVTEVRIESIHEKYSTDIECLISPVITGQLPQNRIEVNRIKIPKNLSLADPAFDKPDEIDLLMGAGLYWQILIGPPTNHIPRQPALQNTRLGWIVGGEILGTQVPSSMTHLSVTNDTLNKQLERFWKQEELPEISHQTDEEKYCEEYFLNTVKRKPDGRFIVRLPQRSSVVLGDSKEQALRRFLSLERRFANDSKLKEDYVAFMDEYLAQNHMSPSKEEQSRESDSYVLPHQAVVRPDSVTTKLRVVFDASARTTLGTSLNDKLLAGPNLQRDLMNIILRFQTHAYVMTADIAMMYRQILVDDEDRALQQILWRKNPHEPIKIYDLNTVTYGTTCAPYLAIRCLRELVSQSEDLPNAAKAINEDCYMDDVLTGTKTIKEAVELQKQLSELTIRGQFPLRKWRTNDPRILQHLSEGCQTDKLLTLDKEGAQKTLGLLWNAKEDCLQYHIDIEETNKPTKRMVLPKIAQVFDPLGLIGPVLINGKIIMEQLWLLEINWDQVLPEDICESWQQYYTSLPHISEIRILRNVTAPNSLQTFEIFGFGDASEKAYGACLCAVTTDDRGDVHSHIICSKSKVAPLKTISLPRLELEAALLLAYLYTTAKIAYGDRVTNAKLWSDSTIVLGWIKTQPNLLKTFVANRISKIQGLTKHATWHHVPSADNPADILSRGTTIDKLRGDYLWWHGPEWMTEENPWPSVMEKPETIIPELKQVTVTLTSMVESSILERFPSYRKLTRLIAYCLRWRNKISISSKKGILTVDGLEKAETTIAKMVQRETFSQEIRDLEISHEVRRKSKLRALDPVLDNEGLIRVGGRLRNANMTEDQKHQIILPTRHFVTTLIMKDTHTRLHHCPPMQLLSAVRYRFWPLSGRRETNKVVKGCLPCYRFRPNCTDVKMGDLLKQRVTGFTRPFSVTGIDYVGPLQIRESRRRGRVHMSEGYIAVFTCFSTKAVHLELVTELTIEAFMAALRRFTGRRGICSQLFSDNARNFVGTARELKEIYEFLEKGNKDIATNLANQNVNWNFIPPRAPNFGGLWEAAVKSVKRQLYTMTRDMTLTYEEYNTLLIDIEAILNSRPLTALSRDPADPSVLTPSHFLIGDSIIQPVQHNLTEIPDSRLSHWQHLQKRRQQFWRRWQTDYLQELQNRSKWTKGGKNIEIDTLVLIKDDNLPPRKWALGRIVDVFPGHDGIVRVVTVRTQNGRFKRPVRNLCPIPFEDALPGNMGDQTDLTKDSESA